MKRIYYHAESDSLFSSGELIDSPEVSEVLLDGLRAGTRIQAGVGVSTVLPSIDFETYSEAGYYFEPVPPDPQATKWQPPYKVKGVGSQGKGGLPAVGTPAYVAHPSTEVLCMWYDLKDGRGRRAWLPGTPQPDDLLRHVVNGGPLVAWNVTFEFYVWNVVCTRKYGWPPLPLEQCYCDMAKARRFSLPGALGTAAEVLGTGDKDKAGKSLIQKLCRPHTPTKSRPEHRWTWQTSPDDMAALNSYCGKDVAAEDGASAHIPDLTNDERQVWLADQTVNARGVQVDTETLDAALGLLADTEQHYTDQLIELTGGEVRSVSEVARFTDWLASRGARLPNLQADTVTDWLSRDGIADDVRQALEIRQGLGSSNVKKLRMLALQVSSDGRLRDQYMYCGADRTGRWSAGGVQLQNMTAKGPKVYQCEDSRCNRFFGSNPARGCPRCGAPDWAVAGLPKGEWPIEAVEQAIEDVRRRDFRHLLHVWGDQPIAVLCGCLRGLFTAKPGHDLICCDYSAIEAVVAACLSRCQWRIDVFSTPGECIYTRSASSITGTPIEAYRQYKAERGSDHPDRKKIGKVAELASGYGGWINAWRAFGADMPDDEIKEAILAWRAASPEIVEMWGGQYRWCGPGKWDYKPELYGLEGAAINAILHPGQCFSHIDITYGMRGDVLLCRLPSGRFLHYHRPRLQIVADRLNRGDSYQITFEGYNSNAAKGPVGWVRMDTFGGRLFENVVQAAARDIQAAALVRCERAGYAPVMHTHDEITAEVPEGWGSVEEMGAIMCERPHWASWWPIRSAGWRHKRYQKD